MAEKDFATQLTGFLAGAQVKVDDNCKQAENLWALGWRTKLEFEEGPRYVRVFKAEYHDPKTPNVRTGRTAYCFIDKENGNVLKAAGWKAPDKNNPRSNIYSADFGLSGVNHYGAVYLR